MESHPGECRPDGCCGSHERADTMNPTLFVDRRRLSGALAGVLCIAAVLAFSTSATAQDSLQPLGEPNSLAAPPPTRTATPTYVSEDETTDTIEPVLPPGISDFDVELFGRFAHTWHDAANGDVIEIIGDASLRMGQHKALSRDMVVWFKRLNWRDKPYYELDVFLWQDAEVRQPGGTIETGPALVISLRTFGRLVLNADSTSPQPDDDNEVYQQGLRARRLLDAEPQVEPRKAGGPIQVAPTLEQLKLRQPKPPKRVSFSVGPNGTLTHEQHEGRSIFVAIGDVAVSQGSPQVSGEYLELHANAAVIYLNSDKLGEGVGDLFGEGKGDKKKTPTSMQSDLPPEQEAPLTGSAKDQRTAAADWVSSVYLEGDVILTRGQRMIRAERLYYDFREDRALILDVVARALEPDQGLPIYVRSARVVQLSENEYSATNAQITSSEFHTPHMSIGAREVTLIDKTPRNAMGQITGVQAGTYTAKDTTLNMDGTPLLYWPVSKGDFSSDRQAFKSAKFGYQSDWGGIFETEWYLFNLLGLQQPQGYDASLRLDYYTERGPGVGIDADYVRDDYYGLLRSYYINDHGTDDLGGMRGGNPDTENRGRFLLRHRQLLPQRWELTFEGSYLSDDQYLEWYDRNEYENGKEQETLVSMLKRQDNWEFYSILKYRINEFLTQTERLPDTRFAIVGEPLSPFATAYHDSRVGVVRYRPDERRFFNGQYRLDNTGATGSVLRADTREEVEFPLPDEWFGPVKITPYLMARGTAWDDSPNIHNHDRGGIQRAFGEYGVRSSVMAEKTDTNIESEAFDLHQLRHIIKGDVTAWNSHTNERPPSLTPFTPGVETIDDFGGVLLGLRQRLQTKRGGAGKWRTVDWITMDLEAGFFNNKTPGVRTHGDVVSQRPEDSLSSNFIAGNLQYRLSDTTVVVYDGVYDIDRGNMGTSNISLAVERDPRLSYFVGWRYIHDTDNNLLGLGTNYKLNEKHSLAIREYYDIDAQRNLTTEVTYIRKWPRWYTAISFDTDRALDQVGVNLSIWPEGAPNLALGSKRYTGLANSVGIRPQ